MANEFRIVVSSYLDTTNIMKQLEELSKKATLNINATLSGTSNGLEQVKTQIKQTQDEINKKSTNTKVISAEATKIEIDKIKSSLLALQPDISKINNVSGVKIENGQVQSALVNYTNTAGLAVTQTMKLNAVTGEYVMATGRAKEITKSFTSDMMQSISTSVRYALSIGLIYEALNQLQSGIQYVKDLDKELTNIQLVTGQSRESLSSLGREYNKTAKELSSTTLAVAQSSVEFIRQGKSAQETAELVKDSTILQKLGNLDAADSSEKLTAIMNGFKLEAKDMIGIIDRLVALDNNYATSVKEISTAMQYSSNSAQQAGVDFQHLSAYITVISSTTRQSAEMIGTSLRTMFSRLTDISRGNVLDSTGEDISKVEEGLKRVGIELRDGTHSFKDMQQVIQEVGDKWKTLSETDKAFVGEQIAGIRQKEQFLVLMNNQEKIQQALNIQQNAAGLATQRYGLYLESTEAKANRMKAALEELWQNTINSATIGQVYDLITGILELIDAVGGLAPVLTLVTGLWIAFNIETIKTQVLASSGFLLPLITAIKTFSFETIAATAATKGWGAALTGLSATNAIVLAITAVALAIQAVNTQLIETNRLGVEANVDRWKQVFDSVEKSGGGAKESVEAFRLEIERVDKAIQDGGFAGTFVDRNAIVSNGLRQVIDDLKLSSKSYEEYKKSATEAFEAAGYNVDEHGKVYRETALNALEASAATRIYMSNLEVATAFDVQAARSKHQLTDEYKAEQKAIEDAAAGLFQINTQLKGLQDTAELTGSMLAKSISGEDFNFEDVQKLTDANKDYLQFIDVIDGKIKINTEGLRLYDIQKAQDAYLTMQQEMAVNGLSESEQRQLDLMKAYIQSLADGSAYGTMLAKAQEDLNKAREKAARDALEEEKKSAQIRLKFLQDQKAAADDLLKMTIAMIRQQKEAEKDHLQQQIKDYDDLIDKRIDALQSLKDEEDYKRGLKKDVKSATNIKNQIAILQLDNSPEAKAKILKLQDQLAEEIEDIQNKQRDHKFDLEKDALEKEKEQFKASMQDKIQIIEEYLKQTGTITRDALDLIKNHGQELYGQLMEWNRIYGDGIDQTVVDAWNKGRDAVLGYSQLLIDIENQQSLIQHLNDINLDVTQPWNDATNALEKYSLKLDEVAVKAKGIGSVVGSSLNSGAGNGSGYSNLNGTGGNSSGPQLPDDDEHKGTGAGKVTSGGNWWDDFWKNFAQLGAALPVFHDGLDAGPVGGMNLPNGEILAKLQKGERVFTEQQAANIITNIPKFSNINNQAGNTLQIESLITVQGNLDKTVIPDLERISDRVIEKLNKGNFNRGVLRNTKLYST